jgi:hypothetical protein
MARKLIFVISIIALVTVLTGASFANLVPMQITFGPNTTGSVTIGTTAATFTPITGFAYQGVPAGTFSMSGASLSYANSNSPYSFGPNSQTFTVSIGSNWMTGLLSVQALFINSKWGFFAGQYDITSSSVGFQQTGFAQGSVVDIDFVTYKGNLSSGEIIPGSPVPEPGTIAMVGSGLLAFAGMLRRKL